MTRRRLVRDARTGRRDDGPAVRRAVVIGVPGDEVPHAVDDARAVAAVLRARGYVVTTVDDRRGSAAPPTRAGVLTTVRQVAAACTADDVLVLYACCHGVRARGRPWLLLADSQYTDDGRVVGGLALSDLLDALRRRARRVAVFLEACQIGLGLDPGIGRALRHCGARGGSFALLAGSTTGSQSLDGSDGAVFTRCLRDGLSGGAADPDGAVRMSALARYVQAGVAAWNRSPEGELVDSSQRPILRLELADLTLVPATDHVALAPTPGAAITRATWSASGHRVAIGAADGTVAVYDPRAGSSVWAARPGAAVNALAASIADVVVSVAADGGLAAWRLADGEPMPLVGRPPTPSRAVAWSDSGTALVLAGADGLRLVSVRDAALGDPGQVVAPSPVRVLAAIRGGVVAGGDDGEVRLWLGATGATASVLRLPRPVHALAASTDGLRLVVVGARGAPRWWDLRHPRPRALAGHRAPVRSVAVTADGAWVATGDDAGVVHLFDGATGAPTRRWRGPGPAAAITALAFAPDGATLFVGDAAGRGRLVPR